MCVMNRIILQFLLKIESNPVLCIEILAWYLNETHNKIKEQTWILILLYPGDVARELSWFMGIFLCLINHNIHSCIMILRTTTRHRNRTQFDWFCPSCRRLYSFVDGVSMARFFPSNTHSKMMSYRLDFIFMIEKLNKNPDLWSLFLFQYFSNWSKSCACCVFAFPILPFDRY